jgi:hypothetical protein
MVNLGPNGDAIDAVKSSNAEVVVNYRGAHGSYTVTGKIGPKPKVVVERHKQTSTEPTTLLKGGDQFTIAPSSEVWQGGIPTTPIFEGLGVITSPPNGGKTSLLNEIIKRVVDTEEEQVEFISFAEPGRVYDPVRKQTYKFSNANEKLMVEQFFLALFNPSIKLIAVDSGKEFGFAASKMPTIKTGISSAIITMMTHLDILARQFDKSVLMVVNPLLPDMHEILRVMAQGNASSVFSPIAVKESDDTFILSYEYSTRDMMYRDFSAEETEITWYKDAQVKATDKSVVVKTERVKTNLMKTFEKDPREIVSLKTTIDNDDVTVMRRRDNDAK